MSNKYVIFCISAVLATSWATSTHEAFNKEQIVPDVVKEIPDRKLEVVYKAGKEVQLGNELTPSDVKEQPDVKYEADADSFYTLIMTDPDAPSRQKPIRREWQHWVVVNIPGNKTSEGDVLTAYFGSAPPKGSGLHRYVFLLFKQPKKLNFDEPRHSNTDGNRANFSAQKFADKYNLAKAVAGNFFQAQWDNYVPTAYKKLGN